MEFVVRLESKENPTNVKTFEVWGRNRFVAIFNAFCKIDHRFRDMFVFKDAETIGTNC